MSVDIIVQRDAGDKQGEDIVDGLISTISVALARGRNELDKQSTLKVPAKYETVFRTGRRIGDFIELQDLLEQKVIRGKVVGIVHSITPTRATTLLTVERVSDFG